MKFSLTTSIKAISHIQSPQQCETVQRILFNTGYEWNQGGTAIKYTDMAKQIVLQDRGRCGISYSHSDDNCYDNSITAASFIARYGSLKPATRRNHARTAPS